MKLVMTNVIMKPHIADIVQSIPKSSVQYAVNKLLILVAKLRSQYVVLHYVMMDYVYWIITTRNTCATMEN